jgi:hypothetical protein
LKDKVDRMLWEVLGSQWIDVVLSECLKSERESEQDQPDKLEVHLGCLLTGLIFPLETAQMVPTIARLRERLFARLNFEFPTVRLRIDRGVPPRSVLVFYRGKSLGAFACAAQSAYGDFHFLPGELPEWAQERSEEAPGGHWVLRKWNEEIAEEAVPREEYVAQKIYDSYWKGVLRGII